MRAHEDAMQPVFITGASGNIGQYVVHLLNHQSIPIRIGSRSGQFQLSSPHVQNVVFDFNDSSTYASAITGCGTLFLLRPPAIANTKRTLTPFIDVAYASGVNHIVFVSVTGADTNVLVPHHAVEMHLKASGRSFTILRPGFFAQNLGDAYRKDITEDNRIFLPSGYGRVTFVDTRDIAEISVASLVSPERHRKKEYTLVGREALTFSQVADLLSEQLGRLVRYQPASIWDYWRHLQKRGMPTVQIVVQTVLHVGIRFGQADIHDDTLTQLLHRSPRTMAEYIRDHAMLWQPG
jgi:uncharacterized protein YbjT (DUF2867 family)